MGNDRKPDFFVPVEGASSPAGGGRLAERSSASIASLVSVLLKSTMLIDRFDIIVDTD